MILNINNEYDKIYICSPSQHQDSSQKLINWFGKYIRKIKNLNNLNEEDLDVIVDQAVNEKDFGKSDTEKGIYESIGELKYF